MEKILFIVNPVAGGGKTKEVVPIIKSSLGNKDVEYDIVFTTKPKEATDLVKKLLDKGYTKVVAVGGDGTVNETAFGITEKGKGILGILPSGTGNDLARALNIPLNPKEALKNILNGKIKNIDIGTVNDNLFFNISSIGFDAEVVLITDKIKNKIKSSISYVIALLITVFKFKCIEVDLEIDDVTVKSHVLLVAVGNGKYYGGGINILPMADMEDGYFHVCVVKKLSKLKLLLLLPTIINGSHIKRKKYVKIFKAKKVKLKSRNNIFLNIDGELKKLKEEVIFEISNNKLPIITKG